MRWDRREFIGAILGAGVFHTAAPVARSLNGESLVPFSEAPKVGFSVLQGMTDATSAQFTAVLPRGVFAIEASGGTSPLLVSTQVVERAFSDFTVHKIAVDGLSLGVSYSLRVLNGDGTVADSRTFKALDLSERKVKIGLISCQFDFLHHDDIWAQVESKRADVHFFLGDNVYADKLSLIRKQPADPQQLWERYVLTRNRVAFYFQKELTPALAIWDDHDFGTNDGNRTFAYKDESAIVFETFFAQAPRSNLEAGPGIARRFSAFGADFFLLDDRTFRDPAGGTDLRMLGADQAAWVQSRLAPRAAWLLNGSMFFGAYQGGESFERQYATDFKEFLAKLKSADGVYGFVSGDVHFSEINDVEPELLGYPTFEIVSSGIHSITFPGHENRFTNPRRRSGCATGAHNFVIFEGEVSRNRIEGVATSYSATQVEFSSEIAVARSK